MLGTGPESSSEPYDRRQSVPSGDVRIMAERCDERKAPPLRELATDRRPLYPVTEAGELLEQLPPQSRRGLATGRSVLEGIDQRSYDGGLGAHGGVGVARLR